MAPERLGRRDALGRFAAAGVAGIGLAGLAGCLGSPEEVTLSPGESHQAADGRSVTVESVGVRNALFHDAGDARWVVGSEGTQFVVIAGSLGDGLFDLELDETRYDPADEVDGVDVERIRIDGRRVGGEGTDYRIVPVPRSLGPRQGAVVLPQDDGPDLRWTLSDGLLERIDDPPTFDVGDFETERNRDAETIGVSFSVTRTGGRPEPFRVAVESVAESIAGRGVALETPAGETVSWEDTVGYDPDSDLVRVTVDWGTDRLRFLNP